MYVVEYVSIHYFETFIVPTTWNTGRSLYLAVTMPSSSCAEGWGCPANFRYSQCSEAIVLYFNNNFWIFPSLKHIKVQKHLILLLTSVCFNLRFSYTENKRIFKNFHVAFFLFVETTLQLLLIWFTTILIFLNVITVNNKIYIKK